MSDGKLPPDTAIFIIAAPEGHFVAYAVGNGKRGLSAAPSPRPWEAVKAVCTQMGMQGAAERPDALGSLRAALERNLEARRG